MTLTPEVRLVCSVLAEALAAELAHARARSLAPFASAFFTDGRFGMWCRAVGLNERFVLEQCWAAMQSPVQLGRRRPQGDAT